MRISYDNDEIAGNHPLRAHLSLAVPLLIMDLQRQGGPTEHQIAEMRRRGIVSADYMLFGSEPGEAAELVTQLAEAIAVLAFAPGGIEVFGFKFVGGDQS